MIHSLPSSISQINNLPEAEKIAIYRQLIPSWVFEQYQIHPQTLTYDGKNVVRFRCPAGSRALEITIYHRPDALDPLIYFNMIDTFNHQLMVLLVVINDPDSPRYNVDIDPDGNKTHFGTTSRNIPEEIRAMEAGLAPGQVKRGLRLFKSAIPLFEDFVARMGHDLFQIEPLAYHNAIVFERYGFAYIKGRREMEAIHEGFQPGGFLERKLDGSSPFRRPEFAHTVRGRSWAIHDGILGHPFTGFQMYKRVGELAGVNTFPGAIW